MFVRGRDCTGRRTERRALVLVSPAAVPSHMFDLGPPCCTVQFCGAPLPILTRVTEAAGKLAATEIAYWLVGCRVDIARRA